MDERKEFLSKERMFDQPFVDIEICQLMGSYKLEIEKFPLGAYLNYTPRQLREHYELEVVLAEKLKKATKEERVTLYTSVYDELFRKIKNHPQLIRKTSPEERERKAKNTARTLLEYLGPDSTFLEVGPGDCKLSFEMCKHVKKVYAIDVSEEVTRSENTPDNFELIISDGSSIDVPEGSVDLVYSNQLMEHLHPEDVLDQLIGVYRALKPGGKYYCVTPHKFGGPADVSRFFDEEARGFHLKEYMLSEVCELFKSAGFQRLYLLRRIFSREVGLPCGISIFLENIIKNFPPDLRRTIYNAAKKALSIRVLTVK